MPYAEAEVLFASASLSSFVKSLLSSSINGMILWICSAFSATFHYISMAEFDFS